MLCFVLFYETKCLIFSQEIRLYASGLEGPNEAAKAIVVYLTQRSGKSKSTKNSNEQEYRSVLDNLISDLLVVLFWPEWPAAGMILNIICRYMVNIQKISTACD